MIKTVPYAPEMQAHIFRTLLNVLLAIFIFASAEVGRLLAVAHVPLVIPTIWPASGFSLAALLLFGYRCWPGIFIGNLAYAILHLYLNTYGLIAPFFMALSISLGALVEALVGATFVRRYSTPGYFNTIKDILIFLFAGGCITCVIASTTTTATLYAFSQMAESELAFNWSTLWLADTMGVLVFTPLLLVFAIQKASVGLFEYGLECVGMVGLFLGLTLLTFAGYPVGYLFVPINLWVTYRFGLRGATLSMLFISLATLVPIVLGRTFQITALTDELLLIIITSLEVNVATSLVFAMVVNERNAAWNKIREHKIDLIEKRKA